MPASFGSDQRVARRGADIPVAEASTIIARSHFDWYFARLDIERSSPALALAASALETRYVDLCFGDTKSALAGAAFDAVSADGLSGPTRTNAAESYKLPISYRKVNEGRLDMSRLGRGITFSNVIACIALFVALGGSVYAATKIDGRSIKAKSIPGNRLKPKTVTAKQVKPQSLTGSQIKAASLTGAQIKAGSLTGVQVNGSTLTGVTASSVASIQYAVATVALTGASLTGNSGTATCPAGTSVTGGGALVSNDELAFVNDSGPTSTRNGWTATGFGEPGTSLTITAICTAAAGVSG